MAKRKTSRKRTVSKKTSSPKKDYSKLLMIVGVVAVVSLVLSLVALFHSPTTPTGKGFGIVLEENDFTNPATDSFEPQGELSIDQEALKYSTCLSEKGYKDYDNKIADQDKRISDATKQLNDVNNNKIPQCTKDFLTEVAKSQKNVNFEKRSNTCLDSDGQLDFNNGQDLIGGFARDLVAGTSMSDSCVPTSDAAGYLAGGSHSLSSYEKVLIDQFAKALIQGNKEFKDNRDVELWLLRYFEGVHFEVGCFDQNQYISTDNTALDLDIRVGNLMIRGVPFHDTPKTGGYQTAYFECSKQRDHMIIGCLSDLDCGVKGPRIGDAEKFTMCGYDENEGRAQCMTSDQVTHFRTKKGAEQIKDQCLKSAESFKKKAQDRIKKAQQEKSRLQNEKTGVENYCKQRSGDPGEQDFTNTLEKDPRSVGATAQAENPYGEAKQFEREGAKAGIETPTVEPNLPSGVGVE